nr:MAG TPA: hypothetical protein [Caudoviricetes sp.]
MTIETKFNIGDKVFFKKNNSIEESEVIGLTISIVNSVWVQYNIKDYLLRLFFEQELFRSKRELEEYYKNLK